METIKEVLRMIIGEIPITMFIVYLFWAYVGMVCYLLVDIYKRDKDSLTSPVKFDVKYWFRDNQMRLLVSAIIIPIILIFYKQISNYFEYSGELSNFFALLIGFNIDVLIDMLKRKGTIPRLPDEIYKINNNIKTEDNE